MKKTAIILAVVIALCAVLCACGSSGEASKAETAAKQVLANNNSLWDWWANVQDGMSATGVPYQYAAIDDRFIQHGSPAVLMDMLGLTPEKITPRRSRRSSTTASTPSSTRTRITTPNRRK